MKSQSLLCGLILCLAGCATPPVQTASGKPEVTITGKSPEEIRRHLMNRWLDKGWDVSSPDPTTVLAEKPASTVMSVFMGSRYDTQAWLRLRATLLDQGGSCRVVVVPYVVSNRKSAFEKEERWSGKTETGLLKTLEEIKTALESPK